MFFFRFGEHHKLCRYLFSIRSHQFCIDLSIVSLLREYRRSCGLQWPTVSEIFQCTLQRIVSKLFENSKQGNRITTFPNAGNP